MYISICIYVTLSLLCVEFAGRWVCRKIKIREISYEDRELRNESEILRQASIAIAEQNNAMREHYLRAVDQIYSDGSWLSSSHDWRKEGF